MSTPSVREAMNRATRFKAGVWAVGFSAVIIVGTLTGATLKQDQQKKEVSLIAAYYPPLPVAGTLKC